MMSLNILFCYRVVCVAVVKERSVDSTFVLVKYVLIFCLGYLCWHFICGLIHTQYWFDVVYVSKEIFVGFVGMAMVNREWPLDLLIIGIFWC